jgi:hypothetical protein
MVRARFVACGVDVDATFLNSRQVVMASATTSI